MPNKIIKQKSIARKNPIVAENLKLEYREFFQNQARRMNINPENIGDDSDGSEQELRDDEASIVDDFLPDEPLLLPSFERINDPEQNEFEPSFFEPIIDSESYENDKTASVQSSSEETENADIWEQFEGRELTDHEMYLMMLLLQTRHTFTDAAVSDLARFANVITRTNRLNTSYKTIVKKARIITPEIKKFFYTGGDCGITKAVTNLNEHVSCEISNCKDCTDEETGKKKEVFPAEAIKNSDNFFCYVSAREWLTYSVPILRDKLKFDHKPDGENIHDVMDGSEYQRLREYGEKVKRANNDLDSKTITLSLGFDGANYSNESNKSLWPIVCYINELPLNLRQTNGLLIALHAGRKPPNEIFKPLIDELIEYNKMPIEIEIKDGKSERFYVRLLLVIADAPARADLLKCKQHSSKYGCNYCYVMSEHLEGASRYPMKPFGFRLRTNEEWQSMAQKIQLDPKTKSPTFGIKGVCQLSRLDYVHLNVIAPPEYMHSQLIGTVKLIIQSWLGEVDGLKRTDERYVEPLTTEQITLINSRLDGIKFPSHQIRKMHLLSSKQTTDKWKAFDYEVFLLYGFLALKDVLETRYYENFLKLSRIISVLSKRHISVKNDILPIKQVVNEFITDYGKIYPVKMHRYNVHCLVHLPDVVLMFGPLFTNSAFCVESSIGMYTRKAENGTHVPQQITNKSVVAASIFTLFTSIDRISFALKEFGSLVFPKLKDMYSFNRPLILQCPLSSTLFTARDRQVLNEYSDHLCSAKLYSRLKFNNLIITTSGYGSTNIQSANYIIKANGVFYRVTKIVQFYNINKVVILGLKYDLVNRSNLSDFYYISQVEPITSSLEMIPLHQIQHNCTAFSINNALYIYDIVNRHI